MAVYTQEKDDGSLNNPMNPDIIIHRWPDEITSIGTGAPLPISQG
jgi:hypothetical protein